MNSFRSITLCYFTFSFLFCTNLEAQYYFEKINKTNGLSDNHITCFLKDSTGFIWIGTKNGLNRYDGTSFEIFRPSAAHSISNEVINDIAQDKSGRLWVATMEGLNIYDPATGQWETMMPNGTRNGLPSYIIRDLHFEENGRVWIVSDVWDLSLYDPITKQFTYFDWTAFHQQSQFKHFPPYRSILKIIPKSKNEYWLGTSIGLCSVDRTSGKFQFHGGAYDDEILDIKYDPQLSNVFLTGKNKLVYCFDEEIQSFSTIHPTPQPYPATKWKKGHELSEKILMPYSGGMVEIDKKNKKAVVISHQPFLQSSLPPGPVNVLHMDNNGIVWAGTNHGIAKFNSRNRSADFIPLTHSQPAEGKGELGAALYDPTERKYFVTVGDTKYLFIIDSNGNIQSLPYSDDQSPSLATNVCRDNSGNIWLLTESHVYRYNREQQKLQLFPTPNKGQPVLFRDMIEDRKGDYWFSTWRDGLYQYKNRDRQFHKMVEADGIWATKVTALQNDPIENAVWVGTFDHGVFRYDLDKRTFTVFTENQSNPTYLQLNLIHDIEPDSSGQLWFTTFGAGLYKYEHGKPFESSFTQINVKQGLPASNYGAITSDRKNRLWLLNNEGLIAVNDRGKFLYKTSPHPSVNFNEFLPERPYPKTISYNRLNDEILVPVSGGLLLYYPDNIANAAPFRIVITGIYEKENDKTFKFAALTYANHPVRYEYKLNENDPEWKQLGTVNSVSFPDLSAGQHHFMVRAIDAAGNVSQNTASYSFYIQPPFWKNGWFIGVLLVLAGFLLYRWIRHLQRKVKAQQLLKYFATSLYGQNTVDDVFWDIAKNCIGRMKLTDCVIYLYDPKRQVLLQKAAYGPKNPDKHEINNPLEIPLGKGIVGSVALSRKAEIIRNTSKDSRYIVDDEQRYSEITVPIIVDNELFGVIDSEHPKKNYFSKYHLRILQEVAAICADKISKYIIQERLQTKISRDLHDEIGSALTSINVLSKVALSKATQDNEMKNYLHRIKNSTAETMNSMSDIVWAINPRNDKLEDISSRMKEFAVDICEGQGIALYFSLPEELEKFPLDLSSRKNIFLIFKEAVNNAVKHSDCKALKIHFKKSENILQMMIEDDGKGFYSNSVTGGNGLGNMQGRATECNGFIFLDSVPGKGTTIRFEMPLPILGVSYPYRKS